MYSIQYALSLQYEGIFYSTSETKMVVVLVVVAVVKDNFEINTYCTKNYKQNNRLYCTAGTKYNHYHNIILIH